MMEMQLLMKDNTLQSSSKERWLSKIPVIMEQVKLEVSRNTSRFSSVIKEIESDAGK